MNYFKRIIPQDRFKIRPLWWTFIMLIVVLSFITFLNELTIN